MEANVPEGWTRTPSLTAGSYQYSNDQYLGWKVYDAGRGGAVTVYKDGDTVIVVISVEQGIGFVESYGKAWDLLQRVDQAWDRYIEEDEFDAVPPVIADVRAYLQDRGI